jgi:hypothetical protein
MKNLENLSVEAPTRSETFDGELRESVAASSSSATMLATSTT